MDGSNTWAEVDRRYREISRRARTGPPGYLSTMPSATATPLLLVIAGPDGAGKSSFAPSLLLRYPADLPYLDIDQIAAARGRGDAPGARMGAGREMVARIRALSQRRASFALETTLSEFSIRQRLTDLVAQGYRLHLHFLWLPDPDMAVERVAGRVRLGGHNVAGSLIRCQYEGGLRNFESGVRMLTERWFAYDAFSMPRPRLVAQGGPGDDVSIDDLALWVTMRMRRRDAR
jgi:predicted ABC-type ATPase